MHDGYLPSVHVCVQQWFLQLLKTQLTFYYNTVVMYLLDYFCLFLVLQFLLSLLLYPFPHCLQSECGIMTDDTEVRVINSISAY